MLYANERTEASPVTLIVIGAVFSVVGLVGLFAKSRGVEIAGATTASAVALVGFTILLIGIVLLLTT